jgi:hypothetical protein
LMPGGRMGPRTVIGSDSVVKVSNIVSLPVPTSRSWIVGKNVSAA